MTFAYRIFRFDRAVSSTALSAGKGQLTGSAVILLTALAIGGLNVGSAWAADTPYKAVSEKAEQASKDQAQKKQAETTTDKSAADDKKATKKDDTKGVASAKDAAQAKDATKQETTMPEVPAPKALPPQLAGECAWTGKRIVSLLARDDVEQARRFLEFFNLFKCDATHLAPSFRCVIKEEPQSSADEAFTDRVNRCWNHVE